MAPLTEEHIWDILDGEAGSEMHAQHEAQLLADESYRTTFVQCEQLHRQLLNLPLESPSMRFNENLMERLAPERRTAPKSDRLPLIFGVVFTILSVLLGILIFSQSNLTAVPTEKGLTTDGVVSMLSNPLFVQVFMLINIVLFFVILDKKILKPYFENREGKRILK
jgi:hypothetical protein